MVTTVFSSSDSLVEGGSKVNKHRAGRGQYGHPAGPKYIESHLNTAQQDPGSQLEHNNHGGRINFSSALPGPGRATGAEGEDGGDGQNLL